MIKNFILDTNVILHDANCIYNFENNNVIIPIVVLEEIDKFKKGDDQKNFNAREFTRKIDEIYTHANFKEGVKLGEKLGILKIMSDITSLHEIKKFFSDKVYKTIIPRNVRLAEAPSHGKPIFIYDKYSRGSEAYLQLTEEFLEKNSN